MSWPFDCIAGPFSEVFNCYFISFVLWVLWAYTSESWAYTNKFSGPTQVSPVGLHRWVHRPVQDTRTWVWLYLYWYQDLVWLYFYSETRTCSPATGCWAAGFLPHSGQAAWIFCKFCIYLKKENKNKNCTKLKNKMACVCVGRLNTRTTSPAGLQGLAWCLEQSVWSLHDFPWLCQIL